jgi:hypothetical protein
MSKSTPSIASIAWFCAQEYERLGAYVQNEVVSVASHPLREKITALNAFGMLDHDVLTVDVLEGRNINAQPADAISVLCVMGAQRFQTHTSAVPFARLPQWTGYYRVADNTYRAKPNALAVTYADADLHFFVLASRRNADNEFDPPITLASGVVSLATVRDQTEYSILVTLKETAGADDDDDDLSSGGASSSMSRTDNGRLKVGLRWSRSADCGQPGRLAASTRTRLQVSVWGLCVWLFRFSAQRLSSACVLNN